MGSDDAPAGGSDAAIDAPVDAAPDAPGPCNVLDQTGCSGNARCTYINQGSALGEMCEPMGTAGSGSACSLDASGIDNCMAGQVCAGTCKPVCNSQGSDTCGSAAVCDLYQHGAGTVGACDKTCDPLNDNDFDGAGTAHTKTGTVCTAAMQGCYGTPVNTGPRKTAFTCASDINYTHALHNRDLCDATSGCATTSGGPYVNGCNQGYEPLLGDQTGMTTLYCAALCKPVNCFNGNCGSPNGAAQVGAFPHRCSNTDALGSFNTSTAGEQCTYWWFFEMDPNNATLNRSPYSDTLGVCLDHSLYKYDSNGDGQVTSADMNLPACSTLPLMGTGMPPQPFGAVDLGCVDTATGGITRQPQRPLIDVRLPYHHVVAP